MNTHITVLVLGLNTETNEIYAEQNIGTSGKDNPLESSKANPMWVTVSNGEGGCEDGTWANHENWLEQIEWVRNEYNARKLPVMIEHSALYYLLNREQITFTHEETDDDTCACGEFLEECERCGIESCPYCDNCNCDEDDEDEE